MGRVAIVDDSQDALELFHFVLKNGHDFIVFADPVEFLRTFGRGLFDLILVDIVMPHADGFTVFKEIRKVDVDVPIAALSAEARPSERDKALQAGFCDYFVKPIRDLEAFRQKVYSHIRKRGNPPDVEDSSES